MYRRNQFGRFCLVVFRKGVLQEGARTLMYGLALRYSHCATPNIACTTRGSAYIVLSSAPTEAGGHTLSSRMNTALNQTGNSNHISEGRGIDGSVTSVHHDLLAIGIASRWGC